MTEIWHFIVRAFDWAYGPDHDLLIILAVFTVADLAATKVDDLYRQRASWGHAVYLTVTRLLLWVIVLMAVELNRALAIDPPILRDGVIWALIATEGVNVLTSLSDLGLPIPPQLTHTLNDLLSQMFGHDGTPPPAPPAPPKGPKP